MLYLCLWDINFHETVRISCFIYLFISSIYVSSKERITRSREIPYNFAINIKDTWKRIHVIRIKHEIYCTIILIIQKHE